MLGLPATTEFNKKIPKQMFYENTKITPELKKSFVSEIKSIYWSNKISSETMNIVPGEKVSEIEIFRIDLHTESISENVLKLIDKSIPYNIIFVLSYENKRQLWVENKQISEKGTVSTNKYFRTAWFLPEEKTLEIKGLNLDAVWENIVVQIGNVEIEEGNTLDEQIAADEKRAKLEKEIARLERMAKNEKQPKKKFEIVQQINRLKAGV